MAKSSQQSGLSVNLSPAGQRIKDQYSGEEYMVFIDESAYQFFGFENPDGNFCYATVGIPKCRYPDVKEALQPTLAMYAGEVRNTPGTAPPELKYTAYRRLDPRVRRKIALAIRSSLEDNGGFVTGFYTPTRGLVMERLRESLLDKVDAVPEDHTSLYEAKADELRSGAVGTGQSAVLSPLLILPVASMLYFMGSLGCPFKIHYDPRERSEDEVLRYTMNDLIGRVIEGLEPEFRGLYLGMEINVPSDQELGLQLADLMAGEVRQFFRSNPVFLNFGTTLKLITPQSSELHQEYREIRGSLFKHGHTIRIPQALRLMKKLTQAREVTLLPYYRSLFAAGLLTCITLLGQERDIRIYEKEIFDLLD